jgi:hypothetical protein
LSEQRDRLRAPLCIYIPESTPGLQPSPGLATPFSVMSSAERKDTPHFLELHPAQAKRTERKEEGIKMWA